MMILRLEKGNMKRTFPIRLYDVRNDGDGLVHVRYITEDGFENHVAIGEEEEKADWHDGYVMNEAGQTIDRIHT